MRLAMRLLRFSLLISLAVVPAAAAEPCRPIAGIESLLRPGLVLLLGEIHGTSESPAFVGDAACHVADRGLPLVVALELPVTGQGGLDSFLGSDGGTEARRAFLAGPFWAKSYQDGRSSQAMLELIERVGRLRRSGAEVRVALFDTGASAGGQARDRGMARRLLELTEADPEAVTLVLTGNIHSRTGPGRPGNADFQPMGYLLARDSAPGRVVALDQAHGGGTAWVCTPRCGVTRLGGRRGERPWEIEIGDAPPSGHDGWYRVGGITASPPARLPDSERQSLRSEAIRQAAARPPSPKTPAAPSSEPAGLLTAAERSLQGRWQGYDHRGGFRTWSLDVQGRGFRAEGSGDWYQGHLVVRADRQPAWIDFVIEECDCAYEGSTSEALFGWTGASLLLAASEPGDPRPAGLQGGGLMRFEPR